MFVKKKPNRESGRGMATQIKTVREKLGLEPMTALLSEAKCEHAISKMDRTQTWNTLSMCEKF